MNYYRDYRFLSLSNTDTTHTSAAVKGDQLHCLNIPDYCMWPVDGETFFAYLRIRDTTIRNTSVECSEQSALSCGYVAKWKRAGKDKGMIEEHNWKLCMWFAPFLWDAECVWVCVHFCGVTVAADRVKMSVSWVQDWNSVCENSLIHTKAWYSWMNWEKTLITTGALCQSTHKAAYDWDSLKPHCRLWFGHWVRHKWECGQVL